MRYYHKQKTTTQLSGYRPGLFTNFYMDIKPKESEFKKSEKILKKETDYKSAS